MRPSSQALSFVSIFVCLGLAAHGGGCTYDSAGLGNSDLGSGGGATGSTSMGGGAGRAATGATGGAGVVGTGGSGAATGGSTVAVMIPLGDAGTGGTTTVEDGGSAEAGAADAGVGVGGSGGAGGSSDGGGVAAGGGGGAGGGIGSGGATGGAAAGGRGAAGAGGVGGTPGAGGAGAADPDLVLWYKFDEASGTTAADSSIFAGGPRNATLATAGTGGQIGFTTMHQVGTHAISMMPNASEGGGFVRIPSLHDLAPTAITISAWIYRTANTRWQRVFDIGDANTNRLALIARDDDNTVRFAIRASGSNADELINTETRLSMSEWHHLVVVLPAGTTYRGAVYVDGVLAGSNAAMTVHPGDLGPTDDNYLGRAQLIDQPGFFPGLLDDFRVYRRALTASEISALMAVR